MLVLSMYEDDPPPQEEPEPIIIVSPNDVRAAHVVRL